MVAEGYDFYNTPLESWLSFCMNKITKNGYKLIPLSEHLKERQENTNDLIDRLEEINSNKEWAD